LVNFNEHRNREVISNGHPFHGNQHRNADRTVVTDKRRLSPYDRRYFDEHYKGSIKDLFHRLLTSARQKGISVELNIDEFEQWRNRQAKICHWCGCLLILGGWERDSLNIDRIDSTKPYRLDNIVLSCLSCNSSRRRGIPIKLRS